MKIKRKCVIYELLLDCQLNKVVNDLSTNPMKRSMAKEYMLLVQCIYLTLDAIEKGLNNV
jgi:hypothetical protein